MANQKYEIQSDNDPANGGIQGSFTLTVRAQTTGTIPFTNAPGDIQGALESLSTVGSGNVVVSEAVGTVGDMTPSNPIQIQFQGALANQYVDASLTIVDSFTDGSSNPVNVTLVETQHGAATPTGSRSRMQLGW